MVWWVNAALAQELPQITLEDAIAQALTSAPGVRVAAEGERSAEARLAQVQGARWPAVGLSAGAQLWNSPHEASFIAGDAEFDCAALTDPFLGGLCAGLSEPLVVREQVTASLTARTGMSITGLLSAERRVDAAEASLDAAQAQGASALAEAEFQAAEAWFLALQADRQLTIADGQAQSLRARVQTAQVAFDGGTVTRNDVLKAELALARAEQAVIQVRTMRDVARARLGLAIGNGGHPVLPAGEPAGAPALPPTPLDELIEAAIGRRADVAAIRAQATAAEQSARAAGLDRLPQLGVNAAYIHTEGQGPFAQRDAAQLGAQLDWTVWAWRARDAGVDAARAAAAQLRAQHELVEAGARVDVRARYDALDAALQAWAVAEGSIAQAEENLRLQDTLHAAGSGTMNDLLDAEAARVEAQSRTAAALYEAHRAAAALRRALGSEE